MFDFESDAMAGLGATTTVPQPGDLDFVGPLPPGSQAAAQAQHNIQVAMAFAESERKRHAGGGPSWLPWAIGGGVIVLAVLMVSRR